MSNEPEFQWLQDSVEAAAGAVWAGVCLTGKLVMSVLTGIARLFSAL